MTDELAMGWLPSRDRSIAVWLRTRLSMVRGFARWPQAYDPRTEVSPTGWLHPWRRRIPYLYSQDDITALLAAARQARRPRSAATYETLIGLVAVTGMRPGEAVRLDRADVALGERLLTIWDSKFGKSRAPCRCTQHDRRAA